MALDGYERFGLVVASLCGCGAGAAGAGAGAGAASLTWVRGASGCPGDKMMDWVLPACGECGRSV
jgi:hypothetical protein